ncbi:MAG TPA: cysteine synthase family protein [Acidimicrobiia bacterium]|nr:cysteine synthase family protein [Acidimicrobiia bacterium]
MLFDSVLGAIGGTPLVRLARIWPGPGAILAKLDYLNPGGSKKDRIALRMIEEAEASGVLAPGQTVVELTSGNTGTGLAIVCAVKSYPFVAVMSKGNSKERAQMMSAFGAEVVLVDQRPGARSGHVTGDDLALVEEAAQRIVIERNAFRADQFHLAGNANAHEHGTGPELWEQSEGLIDLFCEFVGTGGTFAGVARYLKAQNPEVKCFLVEPAGAAVLAGKTIVDPDHRIQGGGYAMENLEGIEPGLVDGMIEVSDETAIDTCRRLARTEGIFAGFSSGACVAAAERLLSAEYAGKSVAVVLADSGMKYLSTDLWNTHSYRHVSSGQPAKTDSRVAPAL